MKAVILAAGKGERLRPLTENIPKVMLKVANKPLLEHNLEQLVGLVDEVVLVVGYHAEVIKSYFGSLFSKIKITYVTQEKQLGTGHAVKQAEKHLTSKFLLMMGDNLYNAEDIKKCLSYDFSILVKEADNPSIFGVCKVKNGLLTSITEKPKVPLSNLVNTGLYVLDKSVFKTEISLSKRKEFEIVDSLNLLAKDKDIHTVRAKEFDHITYPWDLLRINESILKKTGPVIDKSAKISKEARIEGPVVIGKYAEIKDCVIRAYSSIGEGCVIGNNVEVKNSIISDNTKVPHLSYIGDSVLGSNCNLGAGTNIANLRFDDKSVKVKVKGEIVDTGRRKLGCIMGDMVKTGVNASIMPGTLIKSKTMINPGTVYK